MITFVIFIIFVVIIFYTIIVYMLDVGILPVLVLLILFCIIKKIIEFIGFKRINSMFTIKRRNKSIGQSIKLSLFIKLLFRDNYCNGRFSRFLMSEKLKAMKEMESFINKTKYKKLKTRTNDEILKNLKKFEKKGLISIMVSKEIGIKKQPFEKLFIYGGVTLIKNITNHKYWKFIFKDEHIAKYEIIIKERT